MYLEHQGHLQTGQEPFDVDLRDLTVTEIDGAYYLYASTGQNGGLIAYALSATGGMPTLVDTQSFETLTAGTAAGITEVATIDGQTQLIFGGSASNSLLSYSIGADGTLGGLNEISTLDSPSEQMANMAMLDLGGSVACYIVDGETGALSVHTLTPGAAGQNAAPALNTAFVLGTDAQIEIVTFNGQRFLLATDQISHGISSYAIDPATGALTQIDYSGASMGLGISLPTAMETVVAFGQTWVILGSAGSSSLSVLRIDPDGSLTPVDHVIDTLSTRFDALTSLSIAQDEDRVFIVAGGADDGLSLFTLAPDGHLIHLQSLEQTLGNGLANVDQIDTVLIGNTLQVFVSSATSGGLSQFNIALDSLGDTLQAAPGAQILTGSVNDDMLIGSDTGADTLSGGAGNDILISGAAGGDLTGGAGSDRFVIDANASLTRILDFSPGLDQIDLSDFPMLRSVGQLSIRPTAWGARITFRDATIDIYSASGDPMDATDLFGNGFIGPDRVLVLLPDVDDVIWGTPNADTLQGTENDDTIRALAGADTIEAGAGNDLVEADEGEDLIFGGSGNDTLNGEGGNDQVWGGAGDDLVIGGSGNDTLGGSSGNDTIDAGDGDDEAWASTDNDLLYGGAGYDTLGGGSGDDTIWGEDGYDELWGGRNNDEVHGGNGNDIVGGGPGNDQLWGNNGNDTFWANAGRDTLWGGSGNDLMGAGADNDIVYGEAGNDELRLGRGNDLGYGGDGDDTLNGDNGNDTLNGGAGNDSLTGGDGRDELWGEGGDDTLLGGFGRDTLNGGVGNDTIWAGNGDDELVGGAGDDVLVGEAGADIFIFYVNQGNDRIRDFTPGEDLISVGSGATSFADLAMIQQGNDVIIDLGSGTIQLDDVNLNTLSAQDFFFF